MAVITLTNDNFRSEALEAKEPVLVDFWASWCGPCKAMSPRVDEIAEERTDIKVGKVNVDEQNELASQYVVSSIPTLVVLKDGKEVNRSVGLVPKEKILDMLK